MDLTLGLTCLTADVSMNYTFQRPFDTLDAEGFHSELIEALGAFSNMLQWPRYFPQFFARVSWVAGCLPGWFINRFMKPFALVGWILDVSAMYLLCAGFRLCGL